MIRRAVREAGTSIAFPSTTAYLTRDAGPASARGDVRAAFELATSPHEESGAALARVGQVDLAQDMQAPPS